MEFMMTGDGLTTTEGRIEVMEMDLGEWRVVGFEG